MSAFRVCILALLAILATESAAAINAGTGGMLSVCRDRNALQITKPHQQAPIRPAFLCDSQTGLAGCAYWPTMVHNGRSRATDRGTFAVPFRQDVNFATERHLARNLNNALTRHTTEHTASAHCQAGNPAVWRTTVYPKGDV